AKLIYGSLIAGLTSVLLAQRKGIDPLETRSIKLYKEYIKRIST
ncbi:MAG: bifunctional phosphoglucose/phosphomannose isomerase, partial [Thermoprotei archaeon]